MSDRRNAHPRLADLMDCRKRGFASRASAKLELPRIRRKAAAGALHRNEDRTYRCPVCGAWHLTSSERGR